MIKRRVNIGMLLNIKQGPGESLRKYITKFNETLTRVAKPSDGEIIMALSADLRPTRFLLKMTNKPPVSYAEAMERAYKKMDAEETMDQRMKEVLEWETPRFPRNQNKNNMVMSDSSRTNTTATIPGQKEIFRNLKSKGILLPIKPLDSRTLPYRSNGRYCEYHQDQGHTTKECRTLAREIEKYRAQEKLPGTIKR